jgi:hypothetical protein
MGQFIPFPKTKAERLASGDPRKSVEERYPRFQHYFDRVASAIKDLVEDRLMLCEDASSELTRLVNLGLAMGVPAPKNGVMPRTPNLCRGDRGGNDHDDHDDDHDGHHDHD